MRQSRFFIKRRIASDCNNYRGISLVAHASIVVSKIVASRLSNYCEAWGIDLRNSAAFVPYDQQSTCCSSCADCKNSDERGKFPCTYPPSICKRRTSLSTESCYRRTHTLRRTSEDAVIRQFHDGMRARVRSDGEHTEWFDVTQGPRQGCVLSTSSFSVFFAAEVHVVLQYYASVRT